jgi:hypothetical protein
MGAAAVIVISNITMTQIMTQVADFFNGLVSVVVSLLIPATGTSLTPLQVIMWAGLILGFLTFIISLIKRLASQG